MKQLVTVWTHGVHPDKKKDLEAAIRNSTVALGRLKLILEDRERVLLAQERGTDQYLSPSWASLQAHRNGQLAEVASLKSLLAFLDQG